MPTIDLGQVEVNISQPQMSADERRLRNRPDSKAHKLPSRAHMQVQASTVGIASESSVKRLPTLSEAELMAAAAIRNFQILLSVIGCRIVERCAAVVDRVGYKPRFEKNPTRKRAFPEFDSLAAQGSHLQNSEATGGRFR